MHINRKVDFKDNKKLPRLAKRKFPYVLQSNIGDPKVVEKTLIRFGVGAPFFQMDYETADGM